MDHIWRIFLNIRPVMKIRFVKKLHTFQLSQNGTPKIPKNKKKTGGGTWGSHKAAPAKNKLFLGAGVKLRATKKFYTKTYQSCFKAAPEPFPNDSFEESIQIKGVVERCPQTRLWRNVANTKKHQPGHIQIILIRSTVNRKSQNDVPTNSQQHQKYPVDVIFLLVVSDFR